MSRYHLKFFIFLFLLGRCNAKSVPTHSTSTTKESQLKASKRASSPTSSSEKKAGEDNPSVIKIKPIDDDTGKATALYKGDLSLYDFCGGSNDSVTDKDIKHTVEVLTHVMKNVPMKNCKEEVIDKLKNLEELSLGNKEIVSLIPLSQMTKIKKLNLAKNKISNLEGLENMSQIDFLNLSENELENVTILGDLKSLTILWLDKNKIKLLDAFSHSTNLKELHAEQNRLISILEVQALTESGTKVFTSDNDDARFEDETAIRDKKGMCGVNDDKCETIMGVGEKLKGL